MQMTNVQMKSFVAWYKASIGCGDCGWNGNPAALDLDHVPERGTKVANIGTFIRNRDAEALWAEIIKCDVVCARCHRLRTLQRGTSNEQREKISLATKGKKKNLRWSRADTNTSAPRSVESRTKLGETLRRKYPPGSPSRLAQSESLKRNWANRREKI